MQTIKPSEEMKNPIRIIFAARKPWKINITMKLGTLDDGNKFFLHK